VRVVHQTPPKKIPADQQNRNRSRPKARPLQPLKPVPSRFADNPIPKTSSPDLLRDLDLTDAHSERLTSDDRARALAELATLAQRFPKVHLPQQVLDGYLRPSAESWRSSKAYC
jgi:hypothetical protein